MQTTSPIKFLLLRQPAILDGPVTFRLSCYYLAQSNKVLRKIIKAYVNNIESSITKVVKSLIGIPSTFQALLLKLKNRIPDLTKRHGNPVSLSSATRLSPNSETRGFPSHDHSRFGFFGLCPIGIRNMRRLCHFGFNRVIH